MYPVIAGYILKSASSRWVKDNNCKSPADIFNIILNGEIISWPSSKFVLDADFSCYLVQFVTFIKWIFA